MSASKSRDGGIFMPLMKVPANWMQAQESRSKVDFLSPSAFSVTPEIITEKPQREHEIQVWYNGKVSSAGE